MALAIENRLGLDSGINSPTEDNFSDLKTRTEQVTQVAKVKKKVLFASDHTECLFKSASRELSSRIVKKLDLSSKEQISIRQLNELMVDLPFITTLSLPKKITNTENIQLDYGWHKLMILNLKGIDSESFHILPLIKFIGFRELNLSDAKIEDEDLSKLKDIQALKILNLSNCDKISGRGLEYLRVLPRLSELKMTGCPKVKEDDLDLQHLLNMKIHWSPTKETT